MSETPQAMPLDGVRVIDASTFLSGAFFTAQRAEFGAVGLQPELPTMGGWTMPKLVPRLTETPGRVNGPSPPMGAHHDQAYREWLWLGEAEIARLKQQDVI